jgi:predicted Rossmann fold nucleotide-binding protein DprA/Smf involved in DNA uptake
MNVSPQAQAVLLLTAHFSTPRRDEARPLTPTEWGKFALWLRDEKLGPETLLSGNVREKLASWTDPQITQDRIDQLLGRGSALALALEKWLRSGLWILTRSDPAYPTRLKQRLKSTAPAVLFGCGNIRLLEQGGVAVVGSRNASEEDLTYARGIGGQAARDGVSIVSGGARGIDEAAMLGALDAEGTSVGVLPDSLLRASSSLKYRKHLLADNLVLVSPFYPEAGFSAGNAMGRNKYIYCLADAAIVVHSGTSGGTWTGALENLQKKWTRVWVRPTSDPSAGNAEIVERGAEWLSARAEEINVGQLSATTFDSVSAPRADMFGGDERVGEESGDYRIAGVADAAENDGGKTDELPARRARQILESKELEFYDLFLLKVEQVCRGSPRTPADLEKELELNKGQLSLWLKRAVTERKLKKVAQPVRYEWVGDSPQQSIF